MLSKSEIERQILYITLSVICETLKIKQINEYNETEIDSQI